MLLSEKYVFSYIPAKIITYEWNFKTVNGTTEYAPASTEQSFVDVNRGKYLVFYSSVKLNSSDYVLDVENNKITMNFTPEIDDTDLTVIYLGG